MKEQQTHFSNRVKRQLRLLGGCSGGTKRTRGGYERHAAVRQYFDSQSRFRREVSALHTFVAIFSGDGEQTGCPSEASDALILLRGDVM